MSRQIGNTADPAFLAKWQPHRYKLRPKECDMGDGHVCWVRQPYMAISTTGAKSRCTGCKGLIQIYMPRKTLGKD